jgi:hypothetical protein
VIIWIIPIVIVAPQPFAPADRDKMRLSRWAANRASACSIRLVADLDATMANDLAGAIGDWFGGDGATASDCADSRGAVQKNRWRRPTGSA